MCPLLNYCPHIVLPIITLTLIMVAHIPALSAHKYDRRDDERLRPDGTFERCAILADCF